MKRRGAESPDVLLVAYGEGKGAETRTTWSAGQRLDVVGCVCVCVCGGWVLASPEGDIILNCSGPCETHGMNCGQVLVSNVRQWVAGNNNYL